MLRVETISVSIFCPYQRASDFLANPKNLFSWANVLGGKAHPVSPLEWVAEEAAFTDQPVTIRFTPRNSHGVLDVSASIDDQQVFWAPVRAFRNGEGTELTMGLVQRDGQSDESFRSEIEWTRADLLTVKALLETD